MVPHGTSNPGRPGSSARLRPTMRSPLAAVERFFERIFERQAARLFRTRLQPIQLQRRVERAMESNRRRDGDRTVVPSRYLVHLSPDDMAALRDSRPTLAAELADAALAFARAHGYILADRPMVGLMADPAVQAGDVSVRVTTDSRRDAPDEAASGPRPADRSASAGGLEAKGGDGATESGESVPPVIDRTAVFGVPTVDSST